MENNPRVELVESMACKSKQMSCLEFVANTCLLSEFIAFFLSDKKLNWLAWVFHLFR